MFFFEKKNQKTFAPWVPGVFATTAFYAGAGRFVFRNVAPAILACGLGAGAAQAQVGGLHILGTGELRAPAPPQVSAHPPATTQPAAPASPNIAAFTLRRVVVVGASSVPMEKLRAAWAPALGKRVNAADLSLIAARIGDFEGEAGIALYAVSFPPQTYGDGVVRIRVTEMSVVHVVITGHTKGQKLDLLRQYAENILRARPLTRAVLERNILLMGDLAGTKIGSQFVAVPGHPEAVQLVLAVAPQRWFGGFTLNNQGQPLLDNTQAVINVGINNLLHEGERTQFLLGLPLDIRRYQYYGLNDTEPLAANGLSLAVSAGELVSYPIDHGAAGTAQLVGVRLNYPIIRSVHENVIVSGGMDYINAENAFLGFTTSDERTRTLRVSLSYNDDKYLSGLDDAGATISQGLDVLGARRANIAYGGPDFTKGNVNLERVQALPYGFAIRLSAQAQFTDDRLPPSEEFDYGGPEFGQAFTAAELTGDEGLEGVAELGHQIPPRYLPKPLAGTGLFILTDYGRVWNRNTIYAPATDRAASFGFGVKFVILQKLALSLGAATPIITPEYAGPNQHWRFIITTGGHF
jgi:hemolysin activation/secretion protein